MGILINFQADIVDSFLRMAIRPGETFPLRLKFTSGPLYSPDDGITEVFPPHFLLAWGVFSWYLFKAGDYLGSDVVFLHSLLTESNTVKFGPINPDGDLFQNFWTC